MLSEIEGLPPLLSSFYFRLSWQSVRHTEQPVAAASRRMVQAAPPDVQMLFRMPNRMREGLIALERTGFDETVRFKEDSLR